MDFWNKQADQLEATLRNNPDALLRHFLRTATPDQLTEIAGPSFVDSNNARSTVATLVQRMESTAGATNG